MSIRNDVPRCLSVPLVGYFKKASKTHDVSRKVKKINFGLSIFLRDNPCIWVISARKDVPRCLSVPLAGYFKNASKTHVVSRKVKKLWAIYFLTRQPLHLGDVCQKGCTSLFECTSCGIF